MEAGDGKSRRVVAYLIVNRTRQVAALFKKSGAVVIDGWNWNLLDIFETVKKRCLSRVGSTVLPVKDGRLGARTRCGESFEYRPEIFFALHFA